MLTDSHTWKMVTLETIELIFFLDSLPRGVSVLRLSTTRSQTILVTRYYEEFTRKQILQQRKREKVTR